MVFVRFYHQRLKKAVLAELMRERERRRDYFILLFVSSKLLLKKQTFGRRRGVSSVSLKRCSEVEILQVIFHLKKKKKTLCCLRVLGRRGAEMSSSGAATAAATLSGAFGARTRGQKRRMGERDSFSLWDLVVKCDDICFTHVLPRLDSNDLKFLYEVNTETRKLIKRSTREGELKKKFKVNEMSSISTLEVALENKSLWPSDWTERSFCSQVAKTNKLELLKWIREEKKCD